MSLFNELKRRNVFKVVLGYIILGWVVLQVADVVVTPLNLPEWTISFLILIGFLGFPFVVFFSWTFELTPDGIKRDHEVVRDESITQQTGRTIDFLIIGVLVVALSFFIYRSEFSHQATEKVTASSSNKDSPHINSIAVLPFVNISSDKEQEYFSDGLSEELLNLLAKIPQLRVIARTSSFSYKGKDATVSQVAKDLKVAHVLEGSVRKSGSTFRITAQLIRASDSSHLWSESFDREITDVFVVQDEIAKAVVDALKLKLLPEQKYSISNSTSIAPEAYNQYLLGRSFNRLGTFEGWKLAHTALSLSIELEPNYAQAHALLAQTISKLSDYYTTSSEIEVSRAQAMKFAEKAIALNPNLADGYRARALLKTVLYHYDDVKTDLLRALEINPGDSRNNTSYGELLMTLGHFNEALVYLKKAVLLNPLSADAISNIGSIYNRQGKYLKAKATAKQALQLVPGHNFALTNLGIAYLMENDLNSALSLFKKHGDSFWRDFGLALVYFSLGNEQLSNQLLSSIIQHDAYNSAYQIAEIYAWRGENDLAFEWLQRAYKQNDGGLRIIKIDSLIHNLYDDPRFTDLIKQLGLPL